MNSLRTAFLVTGAILLASHAAPAVDGVAPPRHVSHDEVVVFKNGDFLNGHLASFDTKGESEWRHPDTDAPIALSSGLISKLVLDGRPFEDGPVNSWKLHLHNGDSIEGTDPVLEEDMLRLQAINLGEIKVPKPLIAKMVQVLQRRPPIYRGFENIDGWRVGDVNTEGLESGVFTYTNKAVYAFKAASLARDFDLPDIATINMNIAWKGTLGIAIGLYTDTLEPISLLNKEEEDPFGGFYSLAIFNQGAVLRAITHKDPIRTLGQMFVPVLNQRDHTRLEIRVSKPMNAVQLAMDGEVVHTFIDPKGFIGEGTGIRIVHQGRGAVRISDFEIRRWNGEIEGAAQASPFKDADVVWVDGLPQVSGTVTGISPSDVTVRRSNQTSTIAAADVRRIEFKPRSFETSNASPPNARVRFSNGDQITMRVRSINGLEALVDGFGVSGVAVARGTVEEIDFGAVASKQIEEEDESDFVSPFIFSDP